MASMDLTKTWPTGEDIGYGARDAVHVAIIAMKAGELLPSGSFIRKVEGFVAFEGDEHDDPIGIVSPFLERPVKPGEGFVMMLMPGTVKELQHVWQHPAFPLDQDVDDDDYDADDDSCAYC